MYVLRWVLNFVLVDTHYGALVGVIGGVFCCLEFGLWCSYLDFCVSWLCLLVWYSCLFVLLGGLGFMLWFVCLLVF